MTERLQYSDLSKPVDTMPLKVDVCMIQARPDDHQWVIEAKQSVEEQSYPHLGLVVVNNEDRALSIGTAWNACVQASDADLVLIMGDDDGLCNDAVSAMVEGWKHMKRTAPNLVHITTQCTVLDEQTGLSAQMNVTHTGMFVRQYLIDHPFDEEIPRHVGVCKARDITSTQKLTGQPMSMAILHYSGYIWRQHPWMNNGTPIRLHPQPHAHR